MMMDRRAFVGATAALAATGLLAGAPPGRSASGDRVQTAKNLIFMVSDGMSIGAFHLAQRMREFEGKSTAWVDLLRRDGARTVLAATHSANSEVTDSGAASSAWSTGRLVNNGSICVGPKGERPGDDGWPKPLFVRAKKSGRRIGLVTTTRLTHATPAAWVAAHPDRHDEAPIAEQMLRANVDVMFGGGATYIDPALAAGRASANGGQRRSVVRDTHELARVSADASGGSLLGLFSNDHMAYEVDRAKTNQPSLAEMTRAALNRLDAGEHGGFALQVEGGRVDHAAHACDAASILRDQWAFDDAVAEAVRFVEERKDTLLVVTTDHGNASPSITLYGESRLEPLLRASASFETLFPLIRRSGWGEASVSDLREIVREGMAIELDAEEGELFRRSLRKEVVNPFTAMRAPHHVLGSLLANHTGVHFVSGNHTAEHVLLTAIGPGAERVPEMGHLVDTHTAVVGALGLSG